MRLGSRSVWRSRATLFALLGVLLVGNIAVLISHSVFYESRLEGLRDEQRELERKRDEARAAAEKVAADAERLRQVQAQLNVFYSKTLGSRRDRIASLIEEIYAITKKAGFAPDGFSFGEEEVPGAHRLSTSFQVKGRYSDVKKLLAAFENNPQFLVLEGVTVSIDEANPEALDVGLSVAHYFRSEAESPSVATRRRARESSR